MRVTGLQELAAFFGVSDVSIQNWLTEGLPVATRGAPGLPHIFESVDCIKWYA